MTFRRCKIKSVLISATVLMLTGTVTAAAASMFEADGSGEAVAAVYGILGDANSDGLVTIDDATCIQMALAEFPVDSSFSRSAADVNGSGDIDITDVTFIQKWLATIETPYPIGGQFELPTEPPTQRPTDADGWGRDIFQP